MTRTVHVAIGNSDDRLSQFEWHEFVGAVDTAVRLHALSVYGFWVSPSSSPYQNASWAVQLPNEEARDALRTQLAAAASRFRQESVAWNESRTEFLRPDGGTDPLFPIEHDDDNKETE